MKCEWFDFLLNITLHYFENLWEEELKKLSILQYYETHYYVSPNYRKLMYSNEPVVIYSGTIVELYSSFWFQLKGEGGRFFN